MKFHQTAFRNFPKFIFNREEAKKYLGMTDKEIDKVGKTGLLKIRRGVSFYLDRGLKSQNSPKTAQNMDI